MVESEVRRVERIQVRLRPGELEVLEAAAAAAGVSRADVVRDAIARAVRRIRQAAGGREA